MDSDMKTTPFGEDGTVGFISAWESEKDEVGKGEQEILKIVQNESIDYELRFIEPFQSTSTATMSFEKIDENNTKIKWHFTGKMSYPFNLMLVVADFESMIGNDLQDGLNNLKVILEQQ